MSNLQRYKFHTQVTQKLICKSIKFITNILVYSSLLMITLRIASFIYLYTFVNLILHVSYSNDEMFFLVANENSSNEIHLKRNIEETL